MTGISGVGTVILFIAGSVAFVTIMLWVSRILRPDHPNTEKLKTYESGEEPSGTAWGRFNNRFYVVALVFLVFEAELVFLFPWATVFGDRELIDESSGLWARFSLFEAFVFIGILAVGLAYIWVRGMLDWVKPKVKKPDFKSKIPPKIYERFNERY